MSNKSYMEYEILYLMSEIQDFAVVRAVTRDRDHRRIAAF